MTPLRIVIVTVLLVVIGAAVLRGCADSGDKNPVASVENGAPRGLLALKLLLERRGVDVIVRRRAGDAEPPPGAVVVVPPPEASAPNADEIKALLAHVEAGGALAIVCDDDEPRNDRLAPLVKAVGVGCAAAEVAIGDTAETRGVGTLPAFSRTLAVRGLGRVQTIGTEPAVPAMMVGTDPIVAVRAMGAGTVVVVGSATVIANDGIAQGENAAFVLDLAALGAPVVVDQRFHVPRARTAFVSAAQKGSGPTTAALALALLVPLSLLALAPRRGDLAHAQRDDGAPAAEAQARALAALLSRAKRR